MNPLPSSALLPKLRAIVVAAALTAAAPPGRAQDAADSVPGQSPDAAGRVETVHELAARRSATVPAVDVGTRFEEFQRDFEASFGSTSGGDGGDDLERKLGEYLETRWAGSAVERWADRLEGAYSRVEGLYERIEASTRWATSGVSIDPDMEAAIDGRLRLHVQRRVGTMDMGFDVDDAMAGKLGLRLGGEVGRYRLSFDLDDVARLGRFGFQLRRMTR